MEDEDYVEVYIENEKKSVFMVDCPNKISYKDLKKLVKSKNITDINYLYFIVGGNSFDENKEDEII